MTSTGQHILLDLYGCPRELLGNTLFLKETLIQAATRAGATVLFHHFHHFGGESGVTGVLLLAESHISIHTWTETQFVAADIFLCGKQTNIQIASHILINALKPIHHQIHIHQRG